MKSELKNSIIGFPFKLTKSWSDFLFDFVCLIIVIRLTARCVQNIERFRQMSFDEPYLWLMMLGCALAYGFLVLLAHGFTRRGQSFSSPFWYMGLLLFLYGASLVKMLVADSVLSDTIFLRILLGLLSIAFLSGWLKGRREQPATQFNASSKWIIIIIVLWLIHALTYFMESGMDPARTPYGDEGTLWFTAAQEMIQRSLGQAHLQGYPGGGLHPFGISFIAALPAKLIPALGVRSIYFMPLAVILGLGLLMTRFAANRWLFIYFLVGIFSLFHHRGWMSELCYQLVYGEGLSMVFFLIVLYEIGRQTEEKRGTALRFWGTSFIIGLTVLSKLPLALMFPVFLFIYYALIYPTLSSHAARMGVGAGGVFFGVLPYLLWQTFRSIHQLPDSTTPFCWGELVQRLPDPNLAQLSNLVTLFSTEASSFSCFIILSLFFIMLNHRRTLLFLFVPIGILILSVFIYYGYIYSYGSVDGDSASALRYLMPMTMGLLFLGGQSLAGLMATIEQLSWKTPFKLAAGLFLIALFVRKLF